MVVLVIPQSFNSVLLVFNLRLHNISAVSGFIFKQIGFLKVSENPIPFGLLVPW